MHPPLWTTGNNPHKTPGPWTLTLCIVGSQITKFQWSMFHTGRPLFFLFHCTHTESIQQPPSHLVCPLVPLWHCLWKHVHLVLPCLPPLAVVPITHFLRSPLRSLFSSFSLLSIHPLALLLLVVCSPLSPMLHPPPPSFPTMTYSWIHCTHYTDASILPSRRPYEWSCERQMKTIKSIKPLLFFLLSVFTSSPAWRAAFSLILSLFYVLPLRLSCPLALGLGWAVGEK